MTEGKKLQKIKGMLEVQGAGEVWKYQEYSRGFYNGMEQALAIMEERAPEFQEDPVEQIKGNDRRRI